jgi:hypothetical protein
MSAILLLIGESFRTGEQGTRLRGEYNSVESQIEACKSHINFIHSFPQINWKIIIFTYTTSYDKKLKKIYSPYYSRFLEYPIGYNNLFEMSKTYITESKLKYDFLFVSRIDLIFTPLFTKTFNPRWNTIRYPFICWKKDSISKKYYPRVSDTMIFIPKKYNLSLITLNHDSWYELCVKGFAYSDIDVMINTYHDSDSSKDYNPLYTIVNRNKTTNWCSPGERFDKKKQFMESHKLFLAFGPSQYIISPYW